MEQLWRSIIIVFVLYVVTLMCDASQ